ncbi:Holliday junction branch migration protein RuvA [Eggerthellaceae bacterium zg-1084]|uniref:Holliday junction branch migration protein RuvA n=1 Tax=Berryella wangjianweii TaxID=2734634 RepID=UPI0015556B0E|nr:Holliday junction branch migration protein RuvA [Berryella wangjianweii]NPD31641.1 Holliday junction branch migration protein RuvA [Berryella wangjianweii]
MIVFLNGCVAAKRTASALIDVNGVGYEVGMSARSLALLPQAPQQVLVHTHLQVRDDSWQLFGFMDSGEKECFERLITVSGVGAKVALAALSTYSPAQLAHHVAQQDVAAIQRIPGVGKKGASRIVLELKGSLVASDDDEAATALAAPDSSHALATEALLSMGFTSAECELALKGAPEEAAEAALIQYALKRLGTDGA